MTIDVVGLATGEGRFAAILVFRFVLELEQIDHEDRAARSLLHERLQLSGVGWIDVVVYLHDRYLPEILD